MCLGIPMKILKIEGDRALVSAEKVERRIAINFLNKPKIGDYVIVHAGFAIQKVDPDRARDTLEILRKIR
jgi:hydrogenase expression/formation protein HypC